MSKQLKSSKKVFHGGRIMTIDGERIVRNGRTIIKGFSKQEKAEYRQSLYAHTAKSRDALKKAKSKYKQALRKYCDKMNLDINKVMNVPV